MSTVEFDSARLASFRQNIRHVIEARERKEAPGYVGWRKDAMKLIHMNDRQLWATMRLHTFLSWIEYEAREHMRRDRMTPIPAGFDDSEEEQAG
jgi:hypothetical protein